MNKFISKRFASILGVCAVATQLGACASTPGGFNGHSNDGMRMVVPFKHPDRGPVTEEDYAYVARLAHHCLREVADKQLSSAEESALVDGIMYSIAGFAGVGGGSEAAGIGNVLTMGPYGAAAGLANGAVSGSKGHAQNKAGIVGYCTSRLLEDRGVTAYRAGLFAVGSYVRTRNSSKRLPSWVAPAGSAPVSNSSASNDSLMADDAEMGAPPPR